MNILNRPYRYPKWSFTKVMNQIETRRKEEKTKKKKEKITEKKSKGMVVIPYVKGLTEQLKRVYSKHKVATSMKPHMTLRNFLVHPKDEIDTLNFCEIDMFN